MNNYLQKAISNGNPKEQALIRRWWYEQHNSKGQIIWEYHLEGKYADAIWIPKSDVNGIEVPGIETNKTFPLKNQEIVMCEAKMTLTPEVIGQAIVYTQMAKFAGAIVKETIVFSEHGSDAMCRTAKELGLLVVLCPLKENT